MNGITDKNREDGSTPNPPGEQPRLVRSRRHKDSQNRWWIAILVLLVIAALVVGALWYVMFWGAAEQPAAPSESPALFVWSGAWGRTDGAGGGLMIDGPPGSYRVTPYDGALRPGQTITATSSEDGRQLDFTLPSQFSLGGPAGTLSATLTADDDPERAILRITGSHGDAHSLVLERVSELQRAQSPSPTSPAASATATPPAPDDGAGASPTSPEQQMIEAIEAIQDAVEEWAAANNGLFPPPADVRNVGEVGRYVQPWPANPWEPGTPLSPGTEPGDFRYEQLESGSAYRLTGYFDNGSFVVP